MDSGALVDVIWKVQGIIEEDRSSRIAAGHTATLVVNTVIDALEPTRGTRALIDGEKEAQASTIVTSLGKGRCQISAVCQASEEALLADAPKTVEFLTASIESAIEDYRNAKGSE